MNPPAPSPSSNPPPSTVFAIVATSSITYPKDSRTQLPTQPYFKIHYACPNSVPFPESPRQKPHNHVFNADPQFMVEPDSASTFDPDEKEEDWVFPAVMTFGIESEAAINQADPQKRVPKWSVLAWAESREEAETWVKNKRKEKIVEMESKYGKKMGQYEVGIGTAGKFQLLDAERRTRLFWVRVSMWGMMEEELMVVYWAVVEIDVVRAGVGGDGEKKEVKIGSSDGKG